MERHRIVRQQIEKARMSNDRFLNRITPATAMKFNYFNKFMVGLNESISQTEFREQMMEYLGNFLSAAKST
jgi:hypothetical protein